MDVILFSQRLTKLLAGEDEEGRMLEGAKEHIKHLQTEVEGMISLITKLEDKFLSNPNPKFVIKLQEIIDNKAYEGDIVKKILCSAQNLIYFARECEKAVDTCILDIMKEKNESINCKKLCDALHKLEEAIIDIKQGMQQVQDESIQTQAYISSLSSKTVEKDREPSLESLEDKMEELLDLLIEGQPRLSIITIVGNYDIDKTAFAKKAYNDVYIKNYFDCHVWVLMTNNFNPNKILEDIIKHVMRSSDLNEILGKDFQSKKTILHDYLSNKKYFIGFDDFFSTDEWDNLREAFPDNQIGSRILITLSDLSFLDSFQLENGKKFWIDGQFTVTEPLRVIHKDWLFIIFYFGHGPLNKNKLEFPPWFNLRAYINLPFYLRPCFLYFIVFRKGFEISTRHLYQLWIAEGFIEDNSEAMSEKYLEELIDRGWLQVTKRRYGGGIKACSIATLPWRFTSSICECVEFMTTDEHQPQRSCATRKLLSDCGHQNMFFSRFPLLNIRSFFILVSKGNFSPIICNRISKSFKLLRVLDLRAWVITQWPVGIDNLLLLRYLRLNIPSLTSLPSSLCNLVNLFTLDFPSSHIDHASDDIWKMHKLKHLNFGYISFPAHRGKYCDSLEDLNFISGLHPSSCTRDILGRLPSLRSLRIYGDLGSYQSVLPRSLHELLFLESLKLVNETKTSMRSSIVLCEYQFPSTLTHLSLSNTELMDDPMPTLEKLPHLQVLKAKKSSYLGRKLTCCPGGFPSLKVLHLKSMLWLEEWTMGTGAMPKLECLIINPCAYLRKLPEELWHIKTFRKLELWWPQPELKQKLREFEDMEKYDIQIYPFGL